MKTKITNPKEGLYLIWNVRLAFPKLWEPKPMANDPKSTPRFGVTMLIPKEDTDTYEALVAILDKIAKERFKLPFSKLKDTDVCLHDGDTQTNSKGEEIAGYPGNWILVANRAQSQGRPQVRDRSGKRAVEASDGLVYGGSYANVAVTFFRPKSYAKLCCGLETVQHVAPGEAFGGTQVNADEVFEDLGDDEEDGL